MSNRSAKFTLALAAAMLAGANLTAVAQSSAKTAETGAATTDSCLSGPKGTAGAGGHWYYRIDRATKRKCWYIGDAGSKPARVAASRQEDASATKSTPPSRSAAINPSVADARAELPSSNSVLGSQGGRDAGSTDNIQDAAASNPNMPSSAITTRWLDASSMGSSGNFRIAAADTASAPPPAPPVAQPAAPAPIAAAPATDRQIASTQTLLALMIGALGLAAVIGGVILKLTSVRTPPPEVLDQWQAPWAPAHSGHPASMLPHEGTPMAHEEVPRHPRRYAEPQPSSADLQIRDMLARLAKSAAT